MLAISRVKLPAKFVRSVRLVGASTRVERLVSNTGKCRGLWGLRHLYLKLHASIQISVPILEVICYPWILGWKGAHPQSIWKKTWDYGWLPIQSASASWICIALGCVTKFLDCLLNFLTRAQGVNHLKLQRHEFTHPPRSPSPEFEIHSWRIIPARWILETWSPTCNALLSVMVENYSNLVVGSLFRLYTSSQSAKSSHFESSN